MGFLSYIFGLPSTLFNLLCPHLGSRNTQSHSYKISWSKHFILQLASIKKQKDLHNKNYPPKKTILLSQKRFRIFKIYQILCYNFSFHLTLVANLNMLITKFLILFIQMKKF
jgi:hypothetical protein